MNKHVVMSTHIGVTQLFKEAAAALAIYPGVAIHVVSFVCPKLSIDISEDTARATKRLMKDMPHSLPEETAPFLRSRLNELSNMEEDAVVLGTVGLMLSVRECHQAEKGGRNGVTAISSVLVPTFRMLMAAPTWNVIRSAFDEVRCHELRIRDIVEPDVGAMEEVLSGERQARVRLGGSVSGHGKEMALVTAWLACKPRVETFAYSMDAGLIISRRLEVVIDELLKTAEEAALASDDDYPAYCEMSSSK